MGIFASRPELPADYVITTSPTNLKLEAQKIKEFPGHYEQWPKWKSRTECAFDGSGYEKVLTSKHFAAKYEKMNRVVYSQLAVATVDGTAHHLVKQFEHIKDGNAAWAALCEWYDGDVVRNETAETLRDKLENTRLTTTTTASEFVNDFLMRHQELEKIPREGLSKSHVVWLFLRNILDPEYAITVTYLRNSNADLGGCVTGIRKAERELLQKKSTRKMLRQTLRRLKEERGGSRNHDAESSAD